MSLKATLLFDMPQQEIASLITDRMARSSATSIVTGFATPGGLEAIAAPLKAAPHSLKTLIIGAATYPGFVALDTLIGFGVPQDRLRVHLGHTNQTKGRKNPFARYHPMLHSKVYLMELPHAQACAFVGSHNVTSFALEGYNGEAAVLLEGPSNSPEFAKVRSHIQIATNQAVLYSSDMKEAYAWWMREFIDGLKAQIKLPQDWLVLRTILLFASAQKSERPKIGDQIYFEIPAGIEQIETLKTEVHLFLFDALPSDPWQALRLTDTAAASYTCTTLGAENKQGNREVVANWRIDGSKPVLVRVVGDLFRPTTPTGMQQVRAEVKRAGVLSCEYRFDRERTGWDPHYSQEGQLEIPDKKESPVILDEARGGYKAVLSWKLVKDLIPREGTAREKDEFALKRASPESGSFILVSLRRRQKGRDSQEEY